MDNQWVEPGPVLGGEDGGHGFVIGGVGTEAINRLGGKGDKPAIGQQAGRGFTPPSSAEVI